MLAVYVSGLRYGVSNTTTGFRITVSGYSHKLLALLNEVLEKVVAFQVLDDRFEVCSNQLTLELTHCAGKSCSVSALQLIAMRLLRGSSMQCHVGVAHAHTHVRLQSWPLFAERARAA